MPRPPLTPRLASLVPADVAREVCAEVLRHRERQSLALGLSPPDPDTVLDELRAESLPWATAIDGNDTTRDVVLRAAGLGWQAAQPQPEACAGLPGLWHAVLDLIDYARNGGRDDEAQDAIYAVASALYNPASRTAPGFDFAALDETEDAIAVVILAALARQSLAANEPVTPRVLAALGSVTRREVERAIAAGELRAKRRSERGAVVAPKAATAWLRERGVAGFAL